MALQDGDLTALGWGGPANWGIDVALWEGGRYCRWRRAAAGWVQDDGRPCPPPACAPAVLAALRQHFAL